MAKTSKLTAMGEPPSGEGAGERLQQNRERVLADWEKRVKRELPAAIHQDPTALRNMLPKFLDDMARQLKASGKSTEAKHELSDAAKEHGEERANLERYTLSQVLHEYVTLRHVIVDVLRSTGPITVNEVMVILDCVQRAMVLAASHFVEERTIQEKMFTARLEMEAELRDRFVVTLSHDLRNPLSAARISAQMILRQPDQKEACERMATRIVSGIDRVDLMIQDLLDATRVRAGLKLSLEVGSADVGRIAQDAVNEIATIHGNRFLLKATGSLQGVWDARALRRAIENLLTNAVKYGDSVSKITVGLSEENDRVRITVHNVGNPIPLREQATLFEAFRRSDTAESSGKRGWGLGLTLVRGVAEAHGGLVTVSSTVEAGTTFTLDLPKDASIRK